MRKYSPAKPRPATFAAIIDRFNPGVTMLLAAWLAGLSARRYFLDRGGLSETGYEALTSLIYVAPAMLIAWGCLVAADRVFELGLFRRDDD